MIASVTFVCLPIPCSHLDGLFVNVFRNDDCKSTPFRLGLFGKFPHEISPALSARPFLKMHGLRNDFIVVDGRSLPFRPDAGHIRRLCDRHAGIGADQLLVIEPSELATARMRIYNIDGAESETCLNATRCVGWLLLQESGIPSISLETGGGIIDCAAAGEMRVSLHLGPARFDWQSIPLSEPVDTLRLDMSSGPLSEPCAINVGNPHLVCFVPERDAIDAKRWAPAIQNHPLLPQQANVGIAEMVSPDHIRLVVFERPGILTEACGSGACSAALAARRRGLTSSTHFTVEMPGGNVDITIHDDSSFTLTGEIAVAFSGWFPETSERDATQPSDLR